MDVPQRPRFARAPRQIRAEATLARLLQAAAEVIEERGEAGLRLAEVARRAGVTTGAIYARFETREDLLREVYGHFAAESKRAVTERIRRIRSKPASLADGLQAWVAALIAGRRRALRLRNAFLTRIHSDESYRLESRSLLMHIATALVGLLEDHRHVIAHDDLEAAAGMCVLVASASIERAITVREPQSRCFPSSDAALATELTRVLSGYLCSGADASSLAPQRSRKGIPRSEDG